MAEITGVVEKISHRKAYNVLLSDGNWYGHGFSKPVFKEGDEVTFDITMNGDFKNVVVKSVEVLRDGGKPEAPADKPSTTTTGNVKSANTWADNQKTIQWQSARNAAIEWVGVLVGMDAVKLPTKKGDVQGILDEALAYYTRKFNAEAQALDIFPGGDASEEAPASEDFE